MGELTLVYAVGFVIAVLAFLIVRAVVNQLVKWAGRSWLKPAVYGVLLIVLFGEWAVLQARLLYLCHVAEYGVKFDRTVPVLTWDIAENNGCGRLCVKALTEYPIEKVKLNISRDRIVLLTDEQRESISSYRTSEVGNWDASVALSLESRESPLCREFGKIMTALNAPLPDLPDPKTCVGAEKYDRFSRQQTYRSTETDASFLYFEIEERRGIRTDLKGNILTESVWYNTQRPYSAFSRLLAELAPRWSFDDDRCRGDSVYYRFPELVPATKRD